VERAELVALLGSSRFFKSLSTLGERLVVLTVARLRLPLS